MVNFFFFLFFFKHLDFSKNRPEFPLFVGLSQIYKNLRKHLKTLLILHPFKKIKALVMKNIKINFPTNRNLLVFMFFLGFSSLIPLGSHLESLKEKKNHIPPCLTRFFFLPSLFFPFFSLFSSLFFLSWPSSPLLSKLNFLNLHFDPHNLPNYT